MAAIETIRIKDIPTTATTAAADDYIVIDGATNKVRKGLASNLITATAAAAVAGHDDDLSAHGGVARHATLSCGDTVEAFGDSILYGSGSSGGSYTAAAILTAKLGRSTLNNYATPGDQVADMIHEAPVQGYTPATSKLPIVLIGTNDANFGGLDLLPQHCRSLQAILVWLNRGDEILAMGESTFPAGVSHSGTWTGFGAMGGLQYTASAGAYLEFTPQTPGVYLGYAIFDGSACTVLVTADGSPIYSGELTGSRTTNKGTAVGLQMLRVPGDYVGKAVRITMQGAQGTQPTLYVKYVGSSPASGIRPLLICGLIPAWKDGDPLTDSYANGQSAIIRELIKDGYNIRISNTHGTIGPSHIVASDNIHLGNVGQAVLADQFYFTASRNN